ncbi:MAG TPA: TonB-dependent receptor [Acidobacteriaceae bacterium]
MKSRKNFVQNVWLLLFVMMGLALPPGVAKAQNITGEIDGNVTDASGAVIPGATVTIISADTRQLVRTTKTLNSGAYKVPLLQVGTYDVTVSSPGFKSSVTRDVKVDVGAAPAVNFKLVLGDVSAEVTVEANSEAPNVETSENSSVISKTELTELGLSSRNFEQLIALQPGVSYGGPDDLSPGNMSSSGQSNPHNLSINGLSRTQVTWLMDGSDMLNHGGMTQVPTFPSVDSIEEVKVLRSSYGAQYGGGGSAQVLVITKAGGSAFHGDLYYFWRSQYLNATPFFNKLSNPPQPKPPMRYNDFGYSIGGPVTFSKHIRVPKTFFFFSQELRRNTNYPLDNIGNYPEIAQANGYFASPVCVAYTFTNGSSSCKTRAVQVNNSPYSGYNFQVAAIDPVAQGYLKDVINPALAISTPNSTTALQTLNLQQKSPYSETQELVRLDHQFGPRFSAFVRYIFDPFHMSTPCGIYQATCYPGAASSDINTFGESLMAHGTWVATPKIVLEMGFAFEPYQVKSTPNGTVLSSRSPDIQVTLPYVSTLGRVPGLTINGGNWMPQGPYQDSNHTVQAFENTTRQFQSHTLSFGVNFEHYYERVNTGTTNAGQFAFSAGKSNVTVNGTTYTVSAFEQGFTNFLIGNPTSFTQASVDALAQPSESLFETYLQDDWKILPRLTLNAGLRYSIYGQPYDRAGHLGGFAPEAFNPAQAPAIGTTGTICTTSTAAGCGGVTPNAAYNPLNGIVQGSGQSPYGKALSRTPLLNFAPRVGFAWDVFGNGKMSIRAGYGIFYNQSPLASTQSEVAANPAYVQNPVWNTQPIPFGNPSSSAPTNNAVPIVMGQASNWSQPYTQNWSLSLQRSLGHAALIDVGYVGNNTQHLQGEDDLNQPLPGVYVNAGLPDPITSGTSTATLNQIRPYKGYGPIPYASTRFFSDYNALQASLRYRVSRESMVMVSYTWSKSLSNSLHITGEAPQNRYDLRSEWGPSLLDRRNMFVAQYIYHLPFYRHQRGFAGKTLGGWQLSGSLQIMSGVWDTVTQGSNDPAGQGILAAGSDAQERLDMIDKPNGGPKTLSQYFNTAAFAQVPSGQPRPGNEKPNSVLGPGYGVWNAVLSRNIKISEHSRFQFRAEAYNVLNHVNFSTVNVAFNNTNYGTVTAARANRVMQLGAKLYF